MTLLSVKLLKSFLVVAVLFAILSGSVRSENYTCPRNSSILCSFSCTSNGDCIDSTFNCFGDYGCHVLCTGDNSCQDAIVNIDTHSDTATFMLTCDSDDACQDIVINTHSSRGYLYTQCTGRRSCERMVTKCEGSMSCGMVCGTEQRACQDMNYTCNTDDSGTVCSYNPPPHKHTHTHRHSGAVHVYKWLLCCLHIFVPHTMPI